jgi:hypothetical protein
VDLAGNVHELWQVKNFEAAWGIRVRSQMTTK